MKIRMCREKLCGEVMRKLSIDRVIEIKIQKAIQIKSKK